MRQQLVPLCQNLAILRLLDNRMNLVLRTIATLLITSSLLACSSDDRLLRGTRWECNQGQSNAWWIEFHRDHTFAMGFHSDRPGFSGTYQVDRTTIDYSITQPVNTGRLYRPPTSFSIDLPSAPKINFTGYEIGNPFEVPITCHRDSQAEAK